MVFSMMSNRDLMRSCCQRYVFGAFNFLALKVSVADCDGEKEACAPNLSRGGL